MEHILVVLFSRYLSSIISVYYGDSGTGLYFKLDYYSLNNNSSNK